MVLSPLKTYAAKSMRTISASDSSEIVLLICDNCEPRSTCPPSLMVNLSDYGTGALGSILGWAHTLQCFSFFLFKRFMRNYFIPVIWNFIHDKICHSFTFQ